MGALLSLLTKLPSIKINSDCCHGNNNSYSERECTKCGSLYKIPIEKNRHKNISQEIAIIDGFINKSDSPFERA